MRSLVTGGAGFIGSHIVDRLLEDGHEVRILDNFSTGHRHNLAGVLEEVELFEGDLRSYERVHNAVRGCDLVFHQAALPSVPRSVQDPLTSNEVNVGGTLNVLLASRDEGVQRVVFASSSSLYGDSPGFPRREDMALKPLAPYAVSKMCAEQYCSVFARVYGLPTVALRYFNVFGPRQDPFSQYSAVIPKFITAMLDGESPVVHGDGTQSRDFTAVSNVVQANLLAARLDDAQGDVLNVGFGEARSLLDLVDALKRIIGTDVDPVFDAPRPGDVPRSLADISRAQARIGYSPLVSFEQGLARAVDFYQERAHV